MKKQIERGKGKVTLSSTYKMKENLHTHKNKIDCKAVYFHASSASRCQCLRIQKSKMAPGQSSKWHFVLVSECEEFVLIPTP